MYLPFSAVCINNNVFNSYIILFQINQNYIEFHIEKFISGIFTGGVYHPVPHMIEKGWLGEETGNCSVLSIKTHEFYGRDKIQFDKEIF